MHPERFIARRWPACRSATTRHGYEELSPMLQAYDRALLGGTPAEVPQLMAERSPISYVDRVTAPILFIIGRNDSRCPLPQVIKFVDRLGRARPPARDVHLRHGARVVRHGRARPAAGDRAGLPAAPRARHRAAAGCRGAGAGDAGGGVVASVRLAGALIRRGREWTGESVRRVRRRSRAGGIDAPAAARHRSGRRAGRRSRASARAASPDRGRR